jgi:holo-[acyl-carrier protein] synthase
VSSQLHRDGPLAPLVEQVVRDVVDNEVAAIVGVGVDVVDLDAFARQLRVGGDRFLARLLLPDELAYCSDRLDQIATRVAAKEAVVKALRCGFRGVGWREVEIVTAANGAPSVVLHGRATTQAQRQGIAQVHVSCAHEARSAVAVAIAIGEAGESVQRKAGGEGDE